MPELPDITAYLTALEPRVVGKTLERIRITSPLLLRTAIPRIDSVEGKRIVGLRRLGKRIVFVFEDDLFLVLHLMIAGRLHWRGKDAKLGGKQNLAALDFADGSLVLTEAGTKRRASLHLVHGEHALAALDPGGIDVLSATAEQFQHALLQENRTLKRAFDRPAHPLRYRQRVLRRDSLGRAAFAHSANAQAHHRTMAEALHRNARYAEPLDREVQRGSAEGLSGEGDSLPP